MAAICLISLLTFRIKARGDDALIVLMADEISEPSWAKQNYPNPRTRPRSLPFDY
jgi:hypothetical protein